MEAKIISLTDDRENVLNHRKSSDLVLDYLENSNCMLFPQLCFYDWTYLNEDMYSIFGDREVYVEGHITASIDDDEDQFMEEVGEYFSRGIAGYIFQTDGYVTIVDCEEKCIFTGRQVDGQHLCTIFMVDNYSELMDKYKMLEVAEGVMLLNGDLLLEETFGGVRVGDVLFDLIPSKHKFVKYLFNYSMRFKDVCMDVYSMLRADKLNTLVDRYIKKRRVCEEPLVKNEEDDDYIIIFCTCGNLKVFCDNDMGLIPYNF